MAYEINRQKQNNIIEQGIEKGELNKSKEIAKNMLKKKMEIEDIIEITGLTKEQIEEL